MAKSNDSVAGYDPKNAQKGNLFMIRIIYRNSREYSSRCQYLSPAAIKINILSSSARTIRSHFKIIVILIILIGYFAPVYVFPQQSAQNIAVNPPDKNYQITPWNKLSYNQYGDLLDDDPLYNKKHSFLRPAAGIFVQNTAVWFSNRYFTDGTFPKIGFNIWIQNIKNGFAWDDDGINMNFFMHPISGAGYFNYARTNGYNFYDSAIYAAGGSLMWEYFYENTPPSYNDIINTPVNGTFIGEVLYRLSSNILDDTTTGTERTLREAAAGIINPVRAINRIIDGDISNVTSKEVYQKEPLDIMLSGGFRWINNKGHFGGRSRNVKVYDIKLDYGDPFEARPRKPFDHFVFDAEIVSGPGVGRRGLATVIGYGILSGKNIYYKNADILFGIFQHYDYWDSATFVLATTAFGPGIILRKPLGRNSSVYSNFHLGVVPLGGNDTQFGPLASDVRNYNYGGGMETKLEIGLELWRRVNATFIGYYYWIHTYVGITGDNFIGILKPRITFKVSDILNIGFAHQIYYDNRILRDSPDLNIIKTEQRVFISFYLEDIRYKN